MLAWDRASASARQSLAPAPERRAAPQVANPLHLLWATQVDRSKGLTRDVLGAPGRALDPIIKSRMESQLGQDLGRVRIHDDANANRSAEELGANAYAVGRHIVFAPGRYDLSLNVAFGC